MRPRPSRTPERGITLVEVMIALVLLSVGILAISRMFPAGTRSQMQNRARSTANYYAQQKLEELAALGWNDAALTAGRHPAGSACDSLGQSKTWLRFYNVTDLAAPLDNLKRVAVNVSWTNLGVARAVSDTIYLRR